MAAAQQSSSSFPTAYCAACGRNVLTCLDFDGTSELRRCVHCDGVVMDSLRWISAVELEAEGYQFEAPAKAGGCSGGCGTCAIRRPAAG